MAYEKVNNLDSLQLIVEELGRRISASEDNLPTYNKTRDMGYPHIEHDSHGFHYVVVERGRERRRTSTTDIEELLYQIFQHTTFNQALSFELKNRIEMQDSRRILWQHQLELLEQLDASWRIKREKEIQDILTKHPYDDFSSVKATLTTELRKQGFSNEVAWEKACEKYPLPPHKLVASQPPNQS